MNTKQLKELIELILGEGARYLKNENFNSPAAVKLLLGTAAVESACGYYIKQVGSGIARGIFQMEPRTEKDIWDNYLKFKPELKLVVEDYLPKDGFIIGQDMMYNLAYSILMCRIHYLRVPEALPSAYDKFGQAEYWKKYYNTHLGKGTTVKYLETYYNYIQKGI